MATPDRLHRGDDTGPVDRDMGDAANEAGAGGDRGDSEAVTYPDWRVEELARKYDDNEPEERYERGFYHPYG